MTPRQVPHLSAWILSVIAAGLLVYPDAAARQSTSTTFKLPQDQQFSNPNFQVLAMSPDGTQIVYAANMQLYMQRAGESQSRPIPGTLTTPGGPVNPVFSPDGRSIAYWSASDQMVRRIPVEGGTAITLFRAGPPYGMNWGDSDRIVVAQGPSGIVSGPITQGPAETIVKVQPGEGGIVTPVMLPGGEAVMYTLTKGLGASLDAAPIIVQNVKTGERKTIVEGGRDARYLLQGHLVFARGTSLMAVPFNLQRQEITGKPVAVMEDVHATGNGSSLFGMSAGGSLAYVLSENQLQLSSVNLDGTRRDVMKLPQNTFAPRVSPDGKQIVFNTQGDDEAVWIYDLASGQKRVLTTKARGPLWTPDGTRVVYITGDDTEMLYWQRADGKEPAELLVDPARAPESWSPNGELLSFITLKRGATLDYDIWTYSPRDKKARPAIEELTSAQHSSRFSPDGRWLAYVSNETGEYEVFVQPFPTTGAKYQISKGGGLHPLWSKDGRQLYFDNAERLFSVQLQTTPSFQASQPVLMPISGFLAGAVNTRRRYDMTPDGNSFLMMFQRQPQEMRIVSKWGDEVRARAK